jgi:hypothetical protein
MTDVSAIRAIPLCGKVDEWLVWSEKFLAKADSRIYYKESCHFPNLMKALMRIPTKKRKEGVKNAEINEVVFTELIFSIDTKSSEGKVAFNLVKGCKSKEYPDGNAATA